MNNNKALIIAMCVTGFVFNCNSVLATATLVGDSGIVNSSGTDNACNILNSTVRLNLSPKIMGAYDCSGSNSRGVIFGTSHPNGLRSSGKVDCVVVVKLDNGNVVYNNGSGSCVVKEQVVITGGKVFIGSTSGGGVGAVDAKSTSGIATENTSVTAAVELITKATGGAGNDSAGG